jgi:hypothetical protein
VRGASFCIEIWWSDCWDESAPKWHYLARFRDGLRALEEQQIIEYERGVPARIVYRY